MSANTSKYQTIRDFVAEEIAHRDAADPNLASPSDYWKDFNRISRYVRALNDEDLDYIRYHAYHLTGDVYLPYYFMGKRKARRLEKQYEVLLPRLEGFKPCEPEGGFGIDTQYGKINIGIVRYATVMGDLIRSKQIEKNKTQRVLELGGGFGGLALMCMQYNPQLSYLICDLEETMFYSGIFLSLHLGVDKVHVLRGESGDFDNLEPGHVYLLGQHRAETLEGANFDFIINQQSMQEMTSEQVARYCDIIAGCTDQFYSCNHNSHSDKVVEGKGIVASLHSQLADRFNIVWDSHDHEPGMVKAVRASKIFRKLVKITVGLDFMPKEEDSMHRFVYRTK